MVEIKEIMIRNFRSIVDIRIPTKDLNIFVGLNDSGKSNILKALNLFFNNKTDENRSFDFSLDYSKLAPKRKNKAQEITVQLTISLPEHYKDGGDYVWTKKWRSSIATAFYDSLDDPNAKQLFSPFSKAKALLRKISYRYVPAIKSNDYFMRLLGELYASISSDAESEINKKTAEYSNAIQQFTGRIGDIVKESISIDSALSMPPSQLAIFQLLTFSTKDSSDNKILLEQRGDGIKARHIPAILKFIAEYNNKTIGKNTVPAIAIWGYEEPETGVELSKCFEFAEELLSYTKSLQIFITTHSPAFYSLYEENNAYISRYFVFKENNSGPTLAKSELKSSYIHEKIGLMPLITPYVQEREHEIEKLKRLLSDNFLTDMPTIIVEGKTDKAALSYIIKIKSQKLKALLDNDTLRILTREEHGGCNQCVEYVKAWKFAGFTSKIFLLFDRDKAGKNAKESFDSLPESQRPNNCKCKYYEPNGSILYIYSKMTQKGNFEYELEHLLSIEHWNANRNMLHLRDEQELQRIFQAELSRQDSIDTFIDSRFDNTDIRDTILQYTVIDNKKEAFFNAAKQNYEVHKDSTVFDGFSKTLEELEKHFTI